VSLDERADAPPADGALACPACGAPVARDQSWCLACGTPARTRLVPAPSWRWPVALVGTLVAVSLAVLVVAFVALTDDPPAPVTPTTQAPAATQTNPAVPPVTPTTPPATATPPATTSAPDATTAPAATQPAG
jgi:hypothetical protein